MGIQPEQLIIYRIAQPAQGHVASRVTRVREHPSEVLAAQALHMRIIVDIDVVIEMDEFVSADPSEDGQRDSEQNQQKPGLQSMRRRNGLRGVASHLVGDFPCRYYRPTRATNMP